MQHESNAARCRFVAHYRFVACIVCARVFNNRFEATMRHGNEKIASRIQKPCAFLYLKFSFEMKIED